MFFGPEVNSQEETREKMEKQEKQDQIVLFLSSPSWSLLLSGLAAGVKR